MLISISLFQFYPKKRYTSGTLYTMPLKGESSIIINNNVSFTKPRRRLYTYTNILDWYHHNVYK